MHLIRQCNRWKRTNSNKQRVICEWALSVVAESFCNNKYEAAEQCRVKDIYYIYTIIQSYKLQTFVVFGIFSHFSVQPSPMINNYYIIKFAAACGTPKFNSHIVECRECVRAFNSIELSSEQLKFEQFSQFGKKSHCFQSKSRSSSYQICWTTICMTRGTEKCAWDRCK